MGACEKRCGEALPHTGDSSAHALPFSRALHRWIVAGTTIWSGLSYVGAGSASAIKYLK